VRRADRDTVAAARLYRRFREAPARRARRVTVDIPKAVAVMGTVEFVGYMTTHQGKTHLYIHEFAAGSRPSFCAGPGRNQAFLIGGRYRVTERGIVDYGPSGKPVHARRRYKVVRVR